MLTDGRVYAVGSVGHTTLFTPGSKPTDPGSWFAGPDYPPDKVPAWRVRKAGSRTSGGAGSSAARARSCWIAEDDKAPRTAEAAEASCVQDDSGALKAGVDVVALG